MHCCSDELVMLCILFPFIGGFFRRLHKWYHKRIKHKCHQPECQETHAEHIETTKLPSKCSHGRFLNENCSSCIDWSHNGIEWDELILSDAEERFGAETIDALVESDYFEQLTEMPDDDEFTWLVNGNNQLQARWYGRVFLFDADTKQWKEHIT